MDKVIAKKSENKMTAEKLAELFGAKIVTEFPPGSREAMFKNMSDSVFKPKD